MTLEKFVNMFIVLFVVMDPIGVTPMFGTLTRGGGDLHRRRMAFRGVLLAAGILLVFAFIGDWLLHTLGISIPAFKIAGGILLFLIALDMVFARQSGVRSTTEPEQQEARYKEDISVFPLAFPLIAGPGALTTILLMVGEARGNIWYFVSMILVLLLVLAITLLCLLGAGRLMKLLGETGANVMDRLFGVILAALAVQFVVDGIKVGFFS
ncbi:MAG TPA: MarC family protein [Gammaproteobacteria bacterium]|jgi:multiple antibiotic resistance protein|nr:MarC family protein [Gammaproteobacteria bacterium]